MQYRPEQTPIAGNKLTGQALFDVLKWACAEARELYRHLHPDRCRPVMTGCRPDGSTIVMPLPPVHDATPDPRVVTAARSILRSQGCHCVLVYYPVIISRDDGHDHSAPAFGIIVEIQQRGLPPLKRLLPLDHVVRNTRQPLPVLPVIGRSFGVFYPHLLNDEHAA